MKKQELRKAYLQRRRALSEDEYQQLNESLCKNFLANIDLRRVEVLHTFLPIEKNREVDTWQIIDRLRKSAPGLRISVPKINNQSAELEHFYFQDRNQLEANTWGIPEPVEGIPTPVDQIDAVLVHLLAFDRQGHRLGYGRGFYDRFLAGCRPDCKKIGLSFFESEEKIDDIDENDIPLDMVITPQKVFVF